jgi:Ferritin-like domain
VSFADRVSVLTTARTFEDTGVSAYNGAGQFLRNPRHLNVAGKIVSVEARHAAIAHDLLEPRGTSFAGPGVIDDFGLDLADPPAAVLKKGAPYIDPNRFGLVCQNPDFLKSHYEFPRTSRTLCG